MPLTVGRQHFADPGYQTDRIPRYRLDTEAEVRAAWRFIHMPSHRRKYSRSQLSLIERRIAAAMRRHGLQTHAAGRRSRTRPGRPTVTHAEIRRRWDEVRAAEAAGDPMCHPRKFVFGA